MCTENQVCFGRIHGSQLREGANAPTSYYGTLICFLLNTARPREYKSGILRICHTFWYELSLDGGGRVDLRLLYICSTLAQTPSLKLINNYHLSYLCTELRRTPGTPAHALHTLPRSQHLLLYHLVELRQQHRGRFPVDANLSPEHPAGTRVGAVTLAVPAFRSGSCGGGGSGCGAGAGWGGGVSSTAAMDALFGWRCCCGCYWCYLCEVGMTRAS
jgi:hypothetical protein